MFELGSRNLVPETRWLPTEVLAEIDVLKVVGWVKKQRVPLMVQEIPSGKLTWPLKMTFLKMYSLFGNGIFHCQV